MTILDKNVKFTNVQCDRFSYNEKNCDYIIIKKEIWTRDEIVPGFLGMKPSTEYEFQFFFHDNEDAMQFQRLVNYFDKCEIINSYEHNNRVFVMTKNKSFFELLCDS